MPNALRDTEFGRRAPEREFSLWATDNSALGMSIDMKHELDWRERACGIKGQSRVGIDEDCKIDFRHEGKQDTALR